MPLSAIINNLQTAKFIGVTGLLVLVLTVKKNGWPMAKEKVILTLANVHYTREVSKWERNMALEKIVEPKNITLNGALGRMIKGKAHG